MDSPGVQRTQSADGDLDCTTGLHGELEKVNERAMTALGQCAGRLKAVHEVALGQLQDVIKQVHADNKLFLEQVSTAIAECGSKCAGTGETAMDRDKVNVAPRRIQLPGTPEEPDGRSRAWLDARLKEKGVHMAPASNDVQLQRPSAVSFQCEETMRQSSVNSPVEENSRHAISRLGPMSRARRCLSHSVLSQSLDRNPDKDETVSHSLSLQSPSSSPRRFSKPDSEGRTVTDASWSVADSKDDDPKRHHSPGIRRQGHWRSIAKSTQVVKAKSFEVKHSIVTEEPMEICGLGEDMLKDQVRSALLKHRYDVKDQYSYTGLAQKVARSNWFECFTICVVLLNTIWIAISLDLNKEEVLSDADAIFQVGEHSFCAYFTFELLVRFAAFRTTKLAFQDHWFMFDAVLVSLMIFETWVFSILLAFGTADSGDGNVGVSPDMLKLLRLLRLTRMARTARILRFMPQLMILLKGLWLASKSVFFTLVLLVLTVYLFALVFRQVTDKNPIGIKYFPTVWAGFSNLLLKGTLPDLADWVNEVGEESMFFACLLMVFILFATLTVMNMLVGVLVEVVANVSTMENETIMVNMVRQKMLIMIEKLELDKDGNGQLSKKEFEQLLVLPEAALFMQSVGVDVVGLVEFSDFIFKEKELTFPAFVELVLQLRGSNKATVKDIVDMRKQMTAEFERITFDFSDVSAGLARITEIERNSDRDISTLAKEVSDLRKTLRHFSFSAPPAPKILEKIDEPEPPAFNPPPLMDDNTWTRDGSSKIASEPTPATEEVSKLKLPLRQGEVARNCDQEKDASCTSPSVSQSTTFFGYDDITRVKRPFSAQRTQMTSDQKAQWDTMMEKMRTEPTSASEMNTSPDAMQLQDGDMVPFPSHLHTAFESFNRFDYEEEV